MFKRMVLVMFALVSCDRDAQKLKGSRRASSVTSLSASFDWSMPDRLRVDENNVIQWADPNPHEWPVNFDACASSPTGDIKEYRWTFGDGSEAVASRCQGLSHAFPSEGLYAVSLTVASTDGSTAATTRDVNVQDFLIVAFGDSYGAGEGSPDVEIPPSALQRWAELGDLLAQEGLNLSHASDVLYAIDQLSGPVESLLTAISLRDALDCVACTPSCTFCEEAACFAGCIASGVCAPFVCFVCKDDCRNAADKVADAATKVADTLANVVKVEGLEHLEALKDDPTGLKGELDSLRQIWNAAYDAAQSTFQAFKGERDAIPLLSKATWDDKQCHRSSFSAQARTALAIEAADPKSSVTFVHLACSGAKSPHIYRETYVGVDPGDPLDPQLTQALKKVGDREVDAVLLSIGGNDANFAPIIFAGIFQEPTQDPGSPLFTRLDAAVLGIPSFCALTYFLSDKCFTYFDDANSFGLGDPGLKLYDDGVARLPDAYATLNDRLQDAFADLRREPGRVLITEYPDATQDEKGGFCGPRPERLPDIADIPGWSTSEWTWVAQTVTPGINGALRTAAGSNGWTPVTGIFEGFARHGLCSDDNWINRIQESLVHQGDQNGSAHPNRAGYAEVARHETAALRAQLFSGPGGTARAPQVHPVADAGRPIVVDEGSSVAIINNTLDPSRTGHLSFQWSLSISPAGGALLSSTVAPIPTLVALDDTVGTVNLQASNDFGDATAQASLIVRNVAPTVTSGGDLQTVEGKPITLTASFVDPGVLDTHTAAIDWGDGTSTNLSLPMGARVLSAGHKYLNQGLFKPLVVVRDDDGGEGSATTRVAVTNLPPVLGSVAGPPRPIRAGDPAEISAAFSDPGVLDVHTGMVNWGDGTTSPATIVESGGLGTASGAHGYTRPGRYEATLVVTDDDNGSASASTFIVVTGPPVR